MIRLDRKEWTALQEHRGTGVSIFLPTHRVSLHAREDRIRFKNLVGTAEERLIESGLRPPEARSILEPARGLLDDDEFWTHLGDGLAVFLAEGFVKVCRVPLPFEERLVVGQGFHLEPLLPLQNDDERFFILALSQDRVRLLEGTRFSVQEVELNEIPQGLAEALRFDDPEKQLQFHTRAPDRGGPHSPDGKDAMYHGHGGGGDEDKNDLLRYFQKVGNGLHEWLREERIPLVLASVDYYQPIVRQALKYPHLVDEVVSGNPDRLRPEELHERAWAILEKRPEKKD